LTQPKHKQATLTNDIFLVHGHDEEMKQAVARTLSKLDLNPIILHEQPNQGKTIIEKFEKNSDVQFAIVLLSSDDMAFTKTTSPKDARPRPRQNVVLELGYFVGKLSRERVFALKRDGNLELPTDISGVVYTLYDAAGHWRFELVRELKAVGYPVDANALL
jgi:predicted nucleotide-binding protein